VTPAGEVPSLEELQAKAVSLREAQAAVRESARQRGRKTVRGRRRHTRTMQRLGQLPHHDPGVPLADSIAMMLYRLPSFRKLTPVQAKMVIWLTIAIDYQGGALLMGRGQVAGKVGCNKRTINKALPALHASGLIESERTLGGGGFRCPGASGPRRWKLGARLKRFFARLVAAGTPIPGRGHTTPTAGVGSAAASLEGVSGRASRADFFSRLTAAVEPRRLREPDRRTLFRLAKDLEQPAYVDIQPIALAAARYVGSAAGQSLRMPGQWLRQVCADSLRFWGVEPPAGWKAKPTHADKLNRLRKVLADDETAAAIVSRGDGSCVASIATIGDGSSSPAVASVDVAPGASPAPPSPALPLPAAAIEARVHDAAPSWQEVRAQLMAEARELDEARKRALEEVDPW
jgi:hypothetical protein